MDWQPIDTAPKDDTDILVSCLYFEEDDVCMTTPKRFLAISSYEDKPDRRGYMHRNGPKTATHWMPLPEHPTHAVNTPASASDIGRALKITQ